MDHRYVESHGARLHVMHWAGAGPPLLLLHGNSHCAGTWAPLAERLVGDGFEVFAMDLRGHGSSDAPEEGYDWATYRDDAAAVIRSLDRHDLTVIGHSRGGGTTLLAAPLVRDIVRAVLVFEPAVPLKFVPRPQHVQDRWARADQRRTSFASREAMYTRYREAIAFQHWDEAVLRSYIEHGTEEQADGSVVLRCSPRVEVALHERVRDASAWEGVSSPGLPVLTVFGELGSRMKEPDPMEAIRMLYPQAEMAVMSGATHYGPHEQPDAFAEMIRGFVARTSSGVATAQ